MKHAILEDFDTVWNIFQQNKEWFPHVRKFHIRNRIEWGRCVLDDGVVITYGGRRTQGPQYNSNRMVGTFQADKGDVVLHQIAKDKNGTGNASDVLQRFFKFINANVILSVRSDNMAAKKFYEKNDMVRVGDIQWSKKKKLDGDVWYYINRYMYKPLPDSIVVRESPIHGYGLFATAPIKKGFHLGVSHIEAPGFHQNHIRTPVGGFINHSDKPNCHKIQSPEESLLTYYSLVTSKNIKQDEELTVKYTLYNV